MGLDKELEEEDSEMDPDYVLDSEESDDSLEYRSETEVEQEESQEMESEVEELEECPTTPNCAKVEHKIKKIMEEIDEESSSEDGSDVDELDDCPTTPNCAKVEHKMKKITEEEESSSEVDSQEEDEVCNTPKVANVEEAEELSDVETTSRYKQHYVETCLDPTGLY